MITRDPFNISSDVDHFRQEIAGHFNMDDDINKLVSIFRQVSLCNVIINHTESLENSSSIKGFVYDVLNSIIAIIKKRERYLQLNFRSMVEHVARISLNKTYTGGEFDLTVKTKDFQELKQAVPDEDWGYLHNVYINGCHYIHSSPQANLNVTSKFLSLMEGDVNSSQHKMLKNLFKVVTQLMRVFIKYYHGCISDVFFRNPKDLEKIMGKSLHKHYLSFL